VTYVPTVHHDVFICHAHNDDSPRGSGWVSTFKKDLETSLRARLGTVDVCMDDELAPDEKYRGKLHDDVKSSALFVPVMSPSLLLSEFCNEELSWFRRSPRPTSSNQHASLVFKVVLLPDLDANYRFWVKGVTDVSFYVRTGNVDRVLRPGASQYTDQIEYLAGRVAGRLQDLRTQFDPVFVAKFSNLSLTDEVKKLEADLFGDGHRLLPGVFIPDFDAARGRLRAWIEESKFCIFILGSEYQVEFEELLAFAQESKKRSVFWIGTKEYEERSSKQGLFINKLQNDGLELYVGNLASRFYDRLKSNPEGSGFPEKTDESRSMNRIRFYVISDSKGPKLEKASQLVEQITNENLAQSTPIRLKPLQPLSPSDSLPSERIRQHEELLSSCDAILVDWVQGDKDWLRNTWREVVDRKTDGRAKYKSAAIFTSEPNNKDRTDVLKNLGAVEDVIGKHNPNYVNPGSNTVSSSPTLGRLFDPDKLRRFLASLTDDPS
jgi:hypothetical protein